MFKKILVSLCLFLALALPAYPAVYYFDYAAGDDSTGDGSTGNPWKSIDRCTTTRADGDECRGAKVAITALSGTCTFTNGSTTVTTSEDQTAVVSAGDLVSKNTGLEGWWEVASVASGAITLGHEYWGIGTSGAAVTGYFSTPVAVPDQIDFNDSSVIVSGGWDLSGPTQDGWTVLKTTGSYGLNFGFMNTNLSVSKFIFLGTSSWFFSSNTNTGSSLSDLHIAADSSIGLGSLSSYEMTLSNITLTGGITPGLIAPSSGTLSSVYIYSVGTGGGDYSLGFTAPGPTICNDIRIYNAIQYAISINGPNSTISDLIIDTVRTSSYSDAVWASSIGGKLTIANADISGVARLLTNNASQFISLIFVGGTFSYSGDAYYGSAGYSSQEPRRPHLVLAPASGDAKSYWYRGTVEHDSSGECRSGKCLYIADFVQTYYWMTVPVGTTKITSVAGDATLSVYAKKTAGYTGTTYLRAVMDSRIIQEEEITPTTSWVQYSTVVDTTDLVADKFIELYVICKASAGGLYIDDYSVSQ